MAYVLVTISEVLDREAFLEYARRVPATFEPHGGRYVASDTQPEIKAGEWDYVRVVILEFPSFDAAKRWYESPEYQAIVPIRTLGIRANISLVHGYAESYPAKAAN